MTKTNIRRIPLNKLVPHESAATRSRIDKLPKDLKLVDPIVVRPLLGSDYFHIYQGHNRAMAALDSGALDIQAYVAPPEFSQRNSAIAEYRINQNPGFPLKSLVIVDSDIDRQDLFYREMDRLSKRPTVNLHKGTVVLIEIDVLFDDEIRHFKSLPLKGGIGGIVFSVDAAEKLLEKNYLSRVKQAFGDENEHHPLVLPSYVELFTNGKDARGGGFGWDVSFRWEQTEDFTPPVTSKRPVLSQLTTTVIYPDGNVWRGVVGQGLKKISAIVWSEEVARQLVPNRRKSFLRDEWWLTPTSILIEDDQLTFCCAQDSDACGSTCHGGGCLV